MSPHDPSTCPRCRWAAEREGWHRVGILWMKGDDWLGSFCASLDAVAGLLRELCRKKWSLFWSESHKRWCVWVWRNERSPIYSETNDENDYSCVIEAAMQVLGKEESHDISHTG